MHSPLSEINDQSHDHDIPEIDHHHLKCSTSHLFAHSIALALFAKPIGATVVVQEHNNIVKIIRLIYDLYALIRPIPVACFFITTWPSVWLNFI